MTAFISIQFCFAGFPARRPDGISIFDVEVFPSGIHGNIVVPVAGDAPEFGIPAKRIAPCRIGYQGKEIFCPEVIDPGPGSPGIGDHIFPVLVVEIAVFHGSGFIKKTG